MVKVFIGKELISRSYKIIFTPKECFKHSENLETTVKMFHLILQNYLYTGWL